MHFLLLNVDILHLLLNEITFYSDLAYFSPHFVKNVIGTVRIPKMSRTKIHGNPISGLGDDTGTS